MGMEHKRDAKAGQTYGLRSLVNVAEVCHHRSGHTGRRCCAARPVMRGICLIGGRYPVMSLPKIERAITSF